MKELGFKKEYLNLLYQRTIEKKVVDGVSRITTPLLDRNNDAIEVYVIKEDKYLKITDDGSIINDLILSGLTFKKGSLREKYLHETIANYGVSLGEDNSLEITATEKDYAIKMHMLTQSMIKVSELYVLNRPTVKSLFKEDVRGFLEENEIRYVENVLFAGKSKLSTHYDFAIPKSKNKPERIILTTSNIDLNYAQRTVFGWEDTKSSRKEESVLYIIYEDDKSKPSESVDSTFASYDIKLIDWDGRNNFIPDLSA